MTVCAVQNVNAAILLENANNRKFYAVSGNQESGETVSLQTCHSTLSPRSL